jgi:hypothetical protein
MSLSIQPITLREARAFVDRNHRHHGAPQGGILAIGVNDGSCVVGVAILGRPVARLLQDGYTAEVTRVCVLEGHRNACSMLYGASRRVAFALGFRRLVTYTLQNEPGTSLRGAGWKLIGTAGGGQWSRQSRPRVSTAHPGQKHLWEASP